MSAKTTEQIDKEIQEVRNKFGNVECIIGQLAGENGRNYYWGYNEGGLLNEN